MHSDEKKSPKQKSGKGATYPPVAAVADESTANIKSSEGGAALAKPAVPMGADSKEKSAAGNQTQLQQVGEWPSSGQYFSRDFVKSH